MKVKYEMILNDLFNAGAEEISSAASDAREERRIALEADCMEALASGDWAQADFLSRQMEIA